MAARARLLRPLTPSGLLLLSLAIGAAADVRLPGTQPADGSGDPAFPAFADGQLPGTLVPPGQCARCHGDYRAAGEPVHEVQETWEGSLMANAARDPLFWAALDIANQDDAAIGDVGVGDLCLRCHLPRAWYEGRSRCVTPWGEEFDGSCAVGAPDRGDDDFEGVACQFCHRMYDASSPPGGEEATRPLPTEAMPRSTSRRRRPSRTVPSPTPRPTGTRRSGCRSSGTPRSVVSATT